MALCVVTKGSPWGGQLSGCRGPRGGSGGSGETVFPPPVRVPCSHGPFGPRKLRPLSCLHSPPVTQQLCPPPECPGAWYSPATPWIAGLGGWASFAQRSCVSGCVLATSWKCGPGPRLAGRSMPRLVRGASLKVGQAGPGGCCFPATLLVSLSAQAGEGRKEPKSMPNPTHGPSHPCPTLAWRKALGMSSAVSRLWSVHFSCLAWTKVPSTG